MVMARNLANASELSLDGSATKVPSGPHMVEFIAPRGWTVRLVTEDLQDYFPSIEVPPSRADTNGLDADVLRYLGTASFFTPPRINSTGNTRERHCAACRRDVLKALACANKHSHVISLLDGSRWSCTVISYGPLRASVAAELGWDWQRWHRQAARVQAGKGTTCGAATCYGLGAGLREAGGRWRKADGRV